MIVVRGSLLLRIAFVLLALSQFGGRTGTGRSYTQADFEAAGREIAAYRAAHPPSN